MREARLHYLADLDTCPGQAHHGWMDVFIPLLDQAAEWKRLINIAEVSEVREACTLHYVRVISEISRLREEHFAELGLR